MLRKLRPRSIYDVCAALALFVALGGTAYAVNTVGSTDIIDGQVKSVDVGDNEIGSADVKDNSINTFDVHSFLGVDVVDGSLNDEDVGQGASVDFAVNVGLVPAGLCLYRSVTGLEAEGDHLLLTPSTSDADPKLIFSAEYFAPGVSDSARIKVCNPFATSVNDGTTHFNLLVIDAQ